MAILTDSQLQEISVRVLTLIQQQSIDVSELTQVDSLEGIRSLPSLRVIEGVTEVVEAPLTLLAAGPTVAAEDAAEAATEAANNANATITAVNNSIDTINGLILQNNNLINTLSNYDVQISNNSDAAVGNENAIITEKNRATSIETAAIASIKKNADAIINIAFSPEIITWGVTKGLTTFADYQNYKGILDLSNLNISHEIKGLSYFINATAIYLQANQLTHEILESVLKQSWDAFRSGNSLEVINIANNTDVIVDTTYYDLLIDAGLNITV